MTSVKDQNCYEEYLNVDEKLDDNNSNTEQDEYSGEVEEEDNSVVIIDGDGNYYLQSSDKLIKLENLAETSTVEPKVTAQLANNPNKSGKKSDQKNYLNETSSSKAESQEEVYEFNENEQDVDDPQAVSNEDYTSKGVVKNVKKSKTDEAFTCVICSYKTNKRFLLSKHMKNHSDERPYKCAVCERGFKTNASLINHRNTHLRLKPHACKDCDKTFTTSGELVRHVRYRHTYVKPHKCTECEYRSVEMSKLRRHMRCHTGERPYQCPHCTYASPDTFKLKRHLRTHTGEKPYECDICHARFTQLNSLKYHRLIHSVNEKPVFQCHLCPTTCGRKTDLRLHIKRLHTSDQILRCKRCGKELSDRYSYKMHVKTHQGEKCYRCEFCPYASVCQRYLESHMSIHLNEKPFECDICQASFRQKQLHTRHMKVYHSDNYKPPQQRKKDHKCPHCDKMFAFNGNLIRHMETHDPNSRLSEEKHKLKLGRMERVQKDEAAGKVPENTSTNLADEYSYEEIEAPQVKNEGFQEEEYEGNYKNQDTINYVYEDFEIDDYEETLHQQDENGKQLLIEVKMENTDEMVNIKPQTQQKHISQLKNEKNEMDEITLEDNDDQDFMVIEVIPDDGDDDDGDVAIESELQTLKENSPKIVYLNNKVTTHNDEVTSDYFGFEVDEEENDEANGAIKLFEMIEQD